MLDVIIVGQGLAGSVMAARLMRSGRSVLVIDKGHEKSSSRIAAGVFNPVALKRTSLSWRANEMVKEARDFYSYAGKLTGLTYFRETPLFRIFPDDNEKKAWTNSEKGNLEGYLGNTTTLNDIDVFNPYGAGEVKQTGWMDLPLFLGSVREMLKEKNCLLAEDFDFSMLKAGAEKVEYNGHHARMIIFCEGWQGYTNPYFSYLPFSLNKGEVVKIDVPGLSLDGIIHKNIFILPLPDGSYRAGATFRWNDLSNEPTEEGVHELKEKISKVIKPAFTITGADAGIRPATRDRRPFLGKHPEYSSVVIFNGLGSKGVMMAPLLAKELEEHLFEKGKLHPETDINRFQF